MPPWTKASKRYVSFYQLVIVSLFFKISSRCKTVLDITDKVHLSDSCSSLCHAHYILGCFNFNQLSLAFLLLFSNYYDFINDFNFSFFKTFCFDP